MITEIFDFAGGLCELVDFVRSIVRFIGGVIRISAILILKSLTFILNVLGRALQWQFPRSQTPFGNGIAEPTPLAIPGPSNGVAPTGDVPKWSLGTRRLGRFIATAGSR